MVWEVEREDGCGTTTLEILAFSQVAKPPKRLGGERKVLEKVMVQRRSDDVGMAKHPL